MKRKPAKRKTSRRPTIVLRQDSPKDFALLLGMLGFSYRYIARSTGFAIGTVGYILHCGGVKVRNYRDGKTDLSKVVVQSAARLNLPVRRTPLLQLLDAR